VYTPLLPEFEMYQEGVQHFRYLVEVEGGLLKVNRSLPEHLAELASALARPVERDEQNARFIRAFVRPRGLDVPATPAFVAAIEELGLLDRSRDGSVRAAQTVDKIRTIGVPVTFMFVLFIIVMTTTPQLLNSVLEEKMSRISEVLLGSVTPFQLMLGKLLASTSVSAVLTLVYLTGAAYAARRWGYLDVIDPRMLAWFVVFLLLAAACYARSSERFHRKLVENRWLGPYLQQNRGLTLRQKATILSVLWVGLAATMIWTTQSVWLRLILAAIGIGVTLHVVRLPAFRTTHLEPTES